MKKKDRRSSAGQEIPGEISQRLGWPQRARGNRPVTWPGPFAVRLITRDQIRGQTMQTLPIPAARYMIPLIG